MEDFIYTAQRVATFVTYLDYCAARLCCMAAMWGHVGAQNSARARLGSIRRRRLAMGLLAMTGESSGENDD